MRGNAPKHLLTFFALSIAASPAVLAQGKIRVAIWEFENHAENHWWFWNNLGPAARNQIDTEFSENQLLSSKFSVVERDKLKLALQEQGLATDGAVKTGGGSLSGASLSRDTEWGIASETIQKTAKAVVEKLASGEYLARISTAATPAGGVEGRIIKVEGTRAWINLGALAGIKVGDRVNVFQVGEALIDPDTGAKLGADERQTGNGAVVEVQSKFAVINFTGAAKPKDTIRKQ